MLYRNVFLMPSTIVLWLSFFFFKYWFRHSSCPYEPQLFYTPRAGLQNNFHVTVQTWAGAPAVQKCWSLCWIHEISFIWLRIRLSNCLGVIYQKRRVTLRKKTIRMYSFEYSNNANEALPLVKRKRLIGIYDLFLLYKVQVH